MAIFRKAAPVEPLAVTMAGLRLGQRLLAVGGRDTGLVARLASKVGLTGRACLVDDDEDRLAKAAAEIEAEGALIEPVRAPFGMWPFDPESFDLVVIPQLLPALEAQTRERCAREAYRVLRPGGRAMVIEAGRRAGFGALLQRQSVDPSYEGPVAVLRTAGFTAVRVLAEADGQLFAEGIKKADGPSSQEIAARHEPRS